MPPAPSSAPTTSPSVDWRHGALSVAANRRFLVHADGTPFFYLGDTAWEIFHRLTREEVDLYLRTRAEQRFTVVQAVLLSEVNGLTTPNAYGHLPLRDLDPRRPNEDYFAHVDYVIEQAEHRGLAVGLLPTWGAYTVEEKHVFFEDHPIFTPETAEPYGRFLGERYGRHPHIIWILGGDRPPTYSLDIWRAMVRGIRAGAGTRGLVVRASRLLSAGARTEAGGTPAPQGRRAGARVGAGETPAPQGECAEPLFTYHPDGGHSTTEWLCGEEWLGFHMCQTGHRADARPDLTVARDYAADPARPVMNAEPGYERIPDGGRVGNAKLTAWDARRFAWWSLLAGAHGHTYGANEVWMMWTPEREPITPKCTPFIDADTPWFDAIRYPGAEQMRHVRALLESRPMLERVPDRPPDAEVPATEKVGQASCLSSRTVGRSGNETGRMPVLLCGDTGTGLDLIVAARAASGAWAMAYTTSGRPVTADLGVLAATTADAGTPTRGRVRAWWFDPRNGESRLVGDLPTTGSPTRFTPPTCGPGQDWILVLDDAACRFAPPGTTPSAAGA